MTAVDRCKLHAHVTPHAAEAQRRACAIANDACGDEQMSASYAKAESALSFDKPETVAALLDAASFDSKVVPKLEEYVAHQVICMYCTVLYCRPYTDTVMAASPMLCTQAKNNKYDFEANRQLLKLYQFTPALAKPDVIAKVLLKVRIT